MAIIAKLVSALVLLLERIKGEQTFTLIKTDPKHMSHLVGHSFADYEIHIYCQRKQYCRVYRRWFVPNRTFVLYRVFSRASTGAPGSVIQACQIEADIPAQLPSFVDDNLQRMSAVSAYLDLVIARLPTS